MAAFSLVNFCEQVGRNKSRAMRQIKKYIKESTDGKQGTVPAPRLPNVLDDKDHKEYRKLTKIIKTVLDDLISECLAQECVQGDKCCKCEVDEILIYDNNKKEHELAFSYRKGESLKTRDKLNHILTTMMIIPDNECGLEDVVHHPRTET